MFYSCLSSTFRSAADSDTVWGCFLPSDYQTILSGLCPESECHYSSLNSFSKKQLFFELSHYPILIDQGKKSFSLDKWSGKKCYMVAARDLAIAWGDTPTFWDWISHPDPSLCFKKNKKIQIYVCFLTSFILILVLFVKMNMFEEVAKMKYVWRLEVHGKIRN